MINIWVIIGIGILLIVILMLALRYYADKIHNETLKNINKIFDGIKSFFIIGIGERISSALEESTKESDDNEEDKDNTNDIDIHSNTGTF